jgi:hypothetical protein
MKTWKIEDAGQHILSRIVGYWPPSHEDIKSLSPGDNAMLAFCPNDTSIPGSELQLIKIVSVSLDKFTGIFEGVSHYFKDLEEGVLIEFEVKNILHATNWHSQLYTTINNRCLISNRALVGEEMPHYISWTPPDNANDSGWLFLSDDKDDSNLHDIPLGNVINHFDLYDLFVERLYLEEETRYHWNEEDHLWEEIDEH